MAKRVTNVGIAWLALCSSAAAHPGHGRGGGDFSALHYLIEPAHLLFAAPMLLLVPLVARYGTGIIRSRQRRRS